MPAAVTLKVFKKSNIFDLYIANYHTLYTTPFYIEIYCPFYAADNIAAFNINVGNNVFNAAASNNLSINCAVTVIGEHKLTIQVLYKNGTSITIDPSIILTVYDEWPQYDLNYSRILSETEPELPYSLEEVKIKPNEFGVADIFNSSILKINECINFIKNYSTIIFSKTPTLYVGCLGIHKSYQTAGLRWYTQSNTPNLSEDFTNFIKINSFNKIIDVKSCDSEIYIAQKSADGLCTIYAGTMQRQYESLSLNKIIPAINEMQDITSIFVRKVSEYTRALFISSSNNRIYKIIIYLNENLQFNLTAVRGYVDKIIGGEGDLNESYKFNTPTNLIIGRYIYVLDLNNKCIKRYTDNLGWVSTINISDFADYSPISIAAVDELLYVLTENSRVYVLTASGEIYNKNTPFFDISTNIKKTLPVKIVSDYAGEFFYIVCRDQVKKYSKAGLYVGAVEGIVSDNFTAGCSDLNRNIYISDENKIFKIQEIVKYYSITSPSYNTLYWEEEELIAKEDEFIQDWAINRSLLRLLQNAEALRKSFHSRFKLFTKFINKKIVMQYTAIPISVADTLSCVVDVGVSVNELMLTQVINRDLEKIYNCVESLKYFITATYQPDSNNCAEFCWSWERTMCPETQDPILHVCEVNPISFVELESAHTSYASTNTWAEAYSDCCRDISST